MPPIPIRIGTIPHRVAFPEFEPAPATDDNDGGPAEENESKILPLPQSLQEQFPNLPGVLRNTVSRPWKMTGKRWVSYIEYSHNKK